MSAEFDDAMQKKDNIILELYRKLEESENRKKPSKRVPTEQHWQQTEPVAQWYDIQTLKSSESSHSFKMHADKQYPFQSHS